MTEQNQGPDQVPDEFPLVPGTTGRFVIVTAPAQRVEAAEQGLTTLSDVAGVSPDETSEAGEVDAEVLTNPQASVNFPDLGILVAGAVDREQADRIAAEVQNPENPLQAIVPERRYRALQEQPPDEEEWGGARQGPFEEEPVAEGPTTEQLVAPGAQYSREFLEGYRAAVQNLLEKLAAADLPLLAAEVAPAAFDESQFTWGLQVTKAATSQLSGRGIKVAVLDTGLDLGHPDFAGRNIVSQSFVAGQPVQDGNGHGTHCIGTACGPRVPFRAPGNPPSYGCASNCDIFAGKVLSNQGSGFTAQIIAGIQWAIANGCQVISMSLGRTIGVDERDFNPAYEQVAQVGLQRGTLIVAAAGNDSGRPGTIHPVSEPANSPSILAVGALDESLLPAPFSNGGLFRPHGAVNIAGPGVNVYSSFPRPLLNRRLSGTSMATPHVAGIAALWAETNSMFRGTALGKQLLHSARRLHLPKRDVGAGLVQAP